MIPPFILTNPRLALYALCAVAASGFGQTFFISVMGEELSQAFALSHTAYGSLYSGATLLSAMLLLRLGSLADTWSLPRVTSLAVLALAVGCLCIAQATSALLLGLGFVLIRFGGQGYMAHLGMTTAARYFPNNRGSAVALAAFGFPLAEALLPGGAALSIEHLGWRWAWWAASAVLLAGIWPLLTFLSRKTPAPVQDTNVSKRQEGRRSFTRKQAMRDPGFYMILLGITQGFASTAAGAVWAERYGVLHLGAIRSLVQAIMVVSTAIAPVLFGFLMDMHISLPALSAATATGIFAAACLALLAANPK